MEHPLVLFVLFCACFVGGYCLARYVLCPLLSPPMWWCELLVIVMVLAGGLWFIFSNIEEAVFWPFAAFMGLMSGVYGGIGQCRRKGKMSGKDG